jgi:hypothetical protein
MVDPVEEINVFVLKWYRRSCFRGERMGDHELLDIEEWGLVLNKVCFAMLRSTTTEKPIKHIFFLLYRNSVIRFSKLHVFS